MEDDNRNKDSKYPMILLSLTGMAFAIPSAMITVLIHRLIGIISSVKWIMDFGKITGMTLKALSIINVISTTATVLSILLFLTAIINLIMIIRKRN